MNQSELLKKLVAGKGLPYGWCYCFHEQCQRKEECVRWLSCQYLSEKETHGNAIYPNAWRGGECKEFCQLRVVKTAWGFDHLFKDVKVADAQTLRCRLRSCLGSKGQYYRYKLGQLKLKPDQQDNIKQLFHSYGYVHADFDHYDMEIGFCNK